MKSPSAGRQAEPDAVSPTEPTTEYDKQRNGWLRRGAAAAVVCAVAFAVGGSATLDRSTGPDATQQQSPGTDAPPGAGGEPQPSPGSSVQAGAMQSAALIAQLNHREPVNRANRPANRPLVGNQPGLPRPGTHATSKSAAANKHPNKHQAKHHKKKRSKRHTSHGSKGRTEAHKHGSGKRPASSGQPRLPVKKSAYSIAAHFHEVGPWARYHTGIDFAAPTGTRIHATDKAVVTHAGTGGHAGSWAGNYVTIKFSSGKQMLFAHMSRVMVHTGQHVTGGQQIGKVGQTGRAFGPHTHVELYPAGIKPGKIYQAVDPAPWFKKRHLKP